MGRGVSQATRRDELTGQQRLFVEVQPVKTTRLDVADSVSPFTPSAVRDAPDLAAVKRRSEESPPRPLTPEEWEDMDTQLFHLADVTWHHASNRTNDFMAEKRFGGKHGEERRKAARAALFDVQRLDSWDRVQAVRFYLSRLRALAGVAEPTPPALSEMDAIAETLRREQLSPLAACEVVDRINELQGRLA